MKTFDKSSKLDNVLYDVRGPVVDEAARMEADGLSILKLNIGNPAPFGFNAPEEVILDMRQSLWECQGYSDSKGLFSARKAIMQYCQLKKIPGVTLYGDFDHERTAVAALNIGDMDSGEVSDILSEDYGIATRPGAHCAPRLHGALGTEEQGAVRFSFGWYNTEEEADAAVNALREIAT